MEAEFWGVLLLLLLPVTSLFLQLLLSGLAWGAGGARLVILMLIRSRRRIRRMVGRHPGRESIRK